MDVQSYIVDVVDGVVNTTDHSQDYTNPTARVGLFMGCMAMSVWAAYLVFTRNRRTRVLPVQTFNYDYSRL
jgi:hypothetical protein